MRYASVCSGVEAASLAWMKLGWEAAWFSEIEPFPCAVLKERFLNVPNLGDMTKIKVEDGDIHYGADGLLSGAGIDLLVGGTPCQSYSVAGKREGNRGVSGLSLDYIRLAGELHARWLVWENVPGCLSSTDGLDFAAFLSGLAGWDVPVPKGGWRNAGICRNVRGGYGLAWRVLDAQYTRVPGFPRAIPQRRRRVFLVGYRGEPVGSPLDWTHPAAVLFDGESLSGNPPPRRKAGEEAAGDSGDRAEKAGGCDGENGKRGGGDGDGVVLDLQGGKTSARFTEDGSCPTITRGKGSASDVHSVVDGTRVYSMDSDRSNSMKSANPHSGFHEADVAKTLDTTTPTPQKAQGGQMIVTNSNGGDVMPTLSCDLARQTGQQQERGGVFAGAWETGRLTRRR